jgi:hypothetical protein
MGHEHDDVTPGGDVDADAQSAYLVGDEAPRGERKLEARDRQRLSAPR